MTPKVKVSTKANDKVTLTSEEEGSTDKGNNWSRGDTVRVAVITGVFTLLSAIVGGLIAAYAPTGKDYKLIIVDTQAKMTISEPFRSTYNDNASDEFKSFTNKFRSTMINNVKVQGTAPYNCSVTNLSNGSVIIQFSLNFAGLTVGVNGETMRTAIMDAMDGIRNDTNWNISSPNVTVERVDVKQTADMLPTFTSMPITSSATTTTTPTTTSSPTVSTVVTTPDPFKCVVGGPDFIPASDTYPSNCGKYQQCLNGVAYPLSCSSDRHFVVYNGLGSACNSTGDPNTYCNKLNAAKQTTTTPTT